MVAPILANANAKTVSAEDKNGDDAACKSTSHALGVCACINLWSHAAICGGADASVTQVAQLAPLRRAEVARERELQFYEKLNANRIARESRFSQIRSSASESRREFVSNRAELAEEICAARIERKFNFAARPSMKERRETILDRAAQIKAGRLKKVIEARSTRLTASAIFRIDQTSRDDRAQKYKSQRDANNERAQVLKGNKSLWVNPYKFAFSKPYTSPQDQCKQINKTNFSRCYADSGKKSWKNEDADSAQGDSVEAKPKLEVTVLVRHVKCREIMGQNLFSASCTRVREVTTPRTV